MHVVDIYDAQMLTYELLIKNLDFLTLFSYAVGCYDEYEDESSKCALILVNLTLF